MTRYHSTHNYEGFFRACQVANPHLDWYRPEEFDASYFFKRPVITTLSTEQILDTFALDPDAQPEKINQGIKETCKPYTNHYISVLAEDPLDIEEIKMAINTVFNVADETEIKTRQRTWLNIESVRYPQFATVEQAVNFYGSQPVRQVSFGCPGGQNGFSI